MGEDVEVAMRFIKEGRIPHKVINK